MVEVRSASRTYRSGRTTVVALENANLTLTAGDAVAVVGRSGAGKTTLLNLIGGLDRPTSGEVRVLGRDLTQLTERRLTRFRASSVGMVFQDSYLLPGLTALENVTAAGMGRRRHRDVVAEGAELLDVVGLAERMHFPPSRLSGGQRQRVSIARALLGNRPVLVADEPTGNLDAEATLELLAVFAELRATRNVTLVIATHDPLVSEALPRRIELQDGRISA